MRLVTKLVMPVDFSLMVTWRDRLFNPWLGVSPKRKGLGAITGGEAGSAFAGGTLFQDSPLDFGGDSTDNATQKHTVEAVRVP